MQRYVSVAPMMDWTDKHCRYFMRLISRKVLLYTEMVTQEAILRGDRQHLLGFDPAESPVALQVGGCNPERLAQCAKIAEQWGYSEINLNVGCPSDRVQQGRIGACLMKEPALVAECLAAMRDVVAIPVTVKSRIGVDDCDSYEALCEFMRLVITSGTHVAIVHARKAWLKGLSPKENREVPPLRYEVVHQLKRDFPQLDLIINGGIQTHEQIAEHLKSVDGVMLGRVAYHDPYLLAEVDNRYYGDTTQPLSREHIIEAILPYVEQHLAKGGRLHQITRHMMGLFHGEPGAKAWRRALSSICMQKNATALDLLTASKCSQIAA